MIVCCLCCCLCVTSCVCLRKCVCCCLMFALEVCVLFDCVRLLFVMVFVYIVVCLFGVVCSSFRVCLKFVFEVRVCLGSGMLFVCVVLRLFVWFCVFLFVFEACD